MKELVEILIDKGLTISSAESYTGGQFASSLVSISGVSKTFRGSIVAYQDDIKINVLKVKEDIIKNEGALSLNCVEQMAENICKIMNSDIGVSFSGNAGPNKSEGKEVGEVYIAISFKDETVSYQLFLSGNREEIKNQSIDFVKNKILDIIK